jgi:mono/diheme cytochrome c family protein
VPRYEAPRDDANVQRGRYLARSVALCETCHSDRDFRYYGGPVTPGTENLGGIPLTENFKLPPEVVLPAPSLTPTHLGDWSDGELFRAIVWGVGKDGHGLFAAHPYFQYRGMARSDVGALIAWIRSLPPGERPLPRRDLKYQIVRDLTDAMPGRTVLPKEPPPDGSVAEGRYLATIGACIWCHTPSDPLGFPLPGRDLEGGAAFTVPSPGGGTAFSTNLTPHPTGLGTWTEDLFVQRFQGTHEDAVRSRPIPDHGFNTYMAWSTYARMDEGDLRSIWRYLRTVAPKRRTGPRWTPPAPASPPGQAPISEDPPPP